MSSIALVFPHHLFLDHSVFKKVENVVMVEEYLFFTQYKFHKQKVAFHRASMKAFEEKLKENDHHVTYIESGDDRSDIRILISSLSEKGISEIHYFDPVDDWLGKRIRESCNRTGVRQIVHDSPLFLNSRQDIDNYFQKDKKRYFQTEFYIAQRKRRGILLDAEGRPIGGKWSFDDQNRKKYPRNKIPPDVALPNQSRHYAEAISYVEQYFADNPGELNEKHWYPIDHRGAQKWLSDFLQTRFAEFGPYEDAIVKDAELLNHSLLSPLINTGLLTPDRILNETTAHLEHHDIPINSSEGFIRQIVGWREFIRGVYVAKGRFQRTHNFWQFDRSIPESFYTGTTGILPVDTTIKKVWNSGYCHHIERLMILGNFMLLCEINPDEVYRWFMELFIDAYDWVMVPNVYGMSQFADGGIMSTKPYISGSNYIRKMSDYPKGDWQDVWDGLFWRFLHVHRDFFKRNPRMGMLIRSFDTMDEQKRNKLLGDADTYLENLDSNSKSHFDKISH